MPTPHLPTRLPEVGTTIFTRMSLLASEHHAVNLGQGFPDFPCDDRLLDEVDRAMRAGHNQYPPMTGVPALREAIAAKIATVYGASYHPASEITVTAGATQALTTAILCAVHPGDEVIVIEPVYDSYLPAIVLAGGVPVRIRMTVSDAGFSVPWDQIAAAVTPRTRLIIINTPHNPTGSVLRDADMRRLAYIVRGTDVLILSDEVYEHMVYDGTSTPRSAATRNWPSAVRGVQLRQDLSRDRVENRLRRRARIAHRGVPKSPSVQCIFGQHTHAACAGELYGRSGAVSGSASVLSAQT